MHKIALIPILALSLGALSPAFAATPVASGSATLVLGGDMLEAVSIGMLTGVARGSELRATYDEDGGIYSAIDWTIPASTAAWVAAAGVPALQQVSFTGDLAVTAPFLRGVSTGGSVTISDLAVDFDLRRVSAMVSGDNDLTTGRVDLFTWFEPETQSVTVTPYNRFLCCEGTPPNAERASFSYLISDLRLTLDGQDALAQGLGLTTEDRGFLQVFREPFGSLAVNVTLEGELGQFTTPVPEPSTWALTGMGLLVLAGVARRRKTA